MESVEAEGHTIDEAIERALQRLGVSREKVDIEIVSNASRGLFGLGGRPAKVRATLRRPLEFAANAAGPSPRPPERPTAPPIPVARDAADLRAEGTTPQRRREHRQRPPDTTRRPIESPRAPSPTTAAPAPLNEASIDRARAVLAEIVRLTGSEASVEVAREVDDVRLLITGDASGLLIGRRGQTLDALEYVLHRIMAHDDEVGVRLLVDAENYRLRRREALEQLARRTAERARRSGKPLTLSPMSPRDRRIVHLTLQNDPTLTTRSAGNGFYRKVVIVPAGARRGRRSGPPQTP
jgi:spoIIIJ-associated protein